MLLRRSEILTNRFFVDTWKCGFVDSLRILRKLVGHKKFITSETIHDYVFFTLSNLMFRLLDMSKK